ncbi:peptidoglycan-binding domain-containing protein [Frankia sp. Cas3]|uniref:peptidoglycan-binding domain-containing protein n=1 Tax=Frankia sp. Cas3 TaxID=3073926 RepID=UPI002AD37B24|nr:peptidoglycan-binding domain-containing protein [Frankia sp. Cas3]
MKPNQWITRAVAGLVAGAGMAAASVAGASPAAADHTGTGEDWGQYWNVVGNCNHCVTSGSQVWAVQNNLAIGGVLPSSGIDGQYGPQTEQAIRNWQKANGLTVDGVAGWEVYHSMFSGNDSRSRSSGEPIYYSRLYYVGSYNAGFGGEWRYRQVGKTDIEHDYAFVDYHSTGWLIRGANGSYKAVGQQY